MSKPLSPEQQSLRMSCYEERLDYATAARICRCSVVALYGWVARQNLVNDECHGFKRSNGITPTIGKEIIQLRERGLSFKEIGRLSGYSNHTVTRYLRERGIK